MKRYSIIELTKLNDDELLFEIVNDYSKRFTNPYTPMAVRVRKIMSKLNDRIICRKALNKTGRTVWK